MTIDKMKKLRWRKLINTDSTDASITMTPLDSLDIDDIDDEPEEKSGDRIIFMCQLPKEYEHEGCKRFNSQVYLTVAAIAIQTRDRTNDRLVLEYRALTVLPTIYSNISVNRDPVMHPLAEVSEFNKISFSNRAADEAISKWKIWLGKGYDYLSDDSQFASFLHSVISAEDVSHPYILMNDLGRKKCYACKRLWRGDINSRCNGTVCPYSGRVPLYTKRILTSGLWSALVLGSRMDNGFTVEESSTMNSSYGKNQDVYAFKNATRCELSGRNFVCLDVSGSLMRPRLLVKFKQMIPSVDPEHNPLFERGYACCVACYIKYRGYNVIDTSKNYLLGPEDIAETYITVNITDRHKYNSFLDKVFSYTEDPTVFPRFASFAIPSLNILQLEDKITYLMSARGSECELVTPWMINTGHVSQDGCLELDAWDNQGEMSHSMYITDDFMGNSRDRKITVNQSRNRVTQLLDHVGQSSAVIRRGSRVLSGTTNNTRFEIDTKAITTDYYAPAYIQVNESIACWLGGMPELYVDSLYQTLVNYRALVHNGYILIKPKGVAAFGDAPQPSLTEEQLSLMVHEWQLDPKRATNQSLRKLYGGIAFMDAFLDSFHDYSMPLDPPITSAKMLQSLPDEVRFEFEDLIRYNTSKGIRTNKIEGSSAACDYIPSADGGRSRLVLRGSALGHIHPIAPLERVWDRNLITVQEWDERVTRNEARPTLIDTPPFIWFEAIRYLEQTVDKSISSSRDQGAIRSREDMAGSLSRCYVIWDKGPVIKFPGLLLRLVWGDNLRMSSLLSSRILTTVQQGPNYFIVVSLRETQFYAMNISACEYFGAT